jgi:tRNA(Glu) U13 pseudouridine synthase TruD
MTSGSLAPSAPIWRPFAALPRAWGWIGEDRLELSFRLPPGAYAAAVLQELIAWDPAGGED